ncbi:helix-turn-helix domain-containing protein [Spirillospora sp. NPDC047279]|uniref:AraC-like ligand-binding domain-containing protein n=1 Tax=Spirillospora sp. NPDC047279 TaxID=3155478 RepID=UPI00340B92AE
MDVISTAEIPVEERFALFREVSERLWLPLDARCDPHQVNGFRGRAGFGGFGAVQVTVLTTTPLSVHRTPKLIRRSDPDAFILDCAVRGRLVGEQDGRQAELHVGDLVLRDSSRPYLTSFATGQPASEVLCVQFPRSLLPLPERDLRELTAVRIPGDRGVGALSSAFLLELARRMDEFSPADTARLSTLTVDLLTVALAHELDARDAVPPDTRRRALLAQIHAFIERNLADPELTPGLIASAHHVSPRFLYTLFREEGRTVAGWIRERRLERCRRDLADPGLAAHSISAIAARWGLVNSAHFSQMFRSAYDLSPRQFRRQYTTGRTG